jgi:hypothetical protein
LHVNTSAICCHTNVRSTNQHWDHIGAVSWRFEHYVNGGIGALDFGHSDRCAVVSHCFKLHFLDVIFCGTPFHMLTYHLTSSSMKSLLRSWVNFLCRLFS